MDVVTRGDVNTRRRITGEILKGENYPNHEAIDFYDYYIQLHLDDYFSSILLYSAMNSSARVRKLSALIS